MEHRYLLKPVWEALASENGKALASSLINEPEQWSEGPHNMTHTTTGLEVWIANGRAHFKIESSNDKTLRVKLTMADRFLGWRAYQHWKAEQNPLVEMQLADLLGEPFIEQQETKR